jgi:hypothetical protein
MGSREKLRCWAGWFCLGVVALFAFLGYYFRNVRFTPVAGGFLILSAVFLVERSKEQAERHAIQPGADPRID